MYVFKHTYEYVYNCFLPQSILYMFHVSSYCIVRNAKKWALIHLPSQKIIVKIVKPVLCYRGLAVS